MFKKGIVLILVTVMTLMAIVGCSADSATDEIAVQSAAVPSATPAPTPTPRNDVQTLFGKEITVAVISNGDEAQSALFFEGATLEAQSLGVQVQTVAAGSGFLESVDEALQNGVDAIIACLIVKGENVDALSKAVGEGVAVSVFSTEKISVPNGVSHIYYQTDNAQEMALEAALVYPPHDTPVRMLFMFESEESKAYEVYTRLYEQGKIFPKGMYLMSGEDAPAPEEWLTEMLEDYVEGTIDAIYAENIDMAQTAVQALSAAGRSDMEVFCAGITAASVALMDANPQVFVQAAGADSYMGGLLCVRAALNQIAGDKPAALALDETHVTAAQDTISGLRTANADFYALYSTELIGLLKEFYKNQ